MNALRRRTRSGSKDDEQQKFNSSFGYLVTTSSQTFIENTKEYQSDQIDMSFRDRTGEFLAAVKSLQSRQVSVMFKDTLMQILKSLYMFVFI